MMSRTRRLWSPSSSCWQDWQGLRRWTLVLYIVILISIPFFTAADPDAKVDEKKDEGGESGTISKLGDEVSGDGSNAKRDARLQTTELDEETEALSQLLHDGGLDLDDLDLDKELEDLLADEMRMDKEENDVRVKYGERRGSTTNAGVKVPEEEPTPAVPVDIDQLDPKDILRSMRKKPTLPFVSEEELDAKDKEEPEIQEPPDPNRFYQTTHCSSWSQCSQILIHHAQHVDRCDELTMSLEHEYLTASKLTLLMQSDREKAKHLDAIDKIVAELLANVEIRDSRDESKERRYYLQQLQLLHHILYHSRTLRELASLEVTYMLRSAILQWALSCDDPQARLMNNLVGLRHTIEQREEMFVATVVVEVDKYHNYTKVDLLREDDAGEDGFAEEEEGGGGGSYDNKEKKKKTTEGDAEKKQKDDKTTTTKTKDESKKAER